MAGRSERLAGSRGRAVGAQLENGEETVVANDVHVAVGEGRLVLRSAAEEDGVSMFRKGGHRQRDARAFRIVHRITFRNPHPRHHFTSRRPLGSQERRAGLGGD